MILHGLWTSASTSNGSHRLQSIVDAAEDATGEDFMAQLSRILEYDEGFRLGDRHRRSIFSPDDGDDDEGETNFFDGSGDMIDDDLAPVFSNMSIIAITMVSSLACIHSSLSSDHLASFARARLLFSAHNRRLMSVFFLVNFFRVYYLSTGLGKQSLIFLFHARDSYEEKLVVIILHASHRRHISISQMLDLADAYACLLDK